MSRLSPLSPWPFLGQLGQLSSLGHLSGLGQHSFLFHSRRQRRRVKKKERFWGHPRPRQGGFAPCTPEKVSGREGHPAHPQSAYLKAALVRMAQHRSSTPHWRAYLLDHPLLVLELGFRPHIDLTQPYGFDVNKTVPSVCWLNEWLRTVNPCLLADLFEQSVQALHEEIPGLGEVVAFDVKHIYAHVKENNVAQPTSKSALIKPSIVLRFNP